MTQVANTLIPGSSSCDLGSPTRPWRNVYASNLPSSSIPVGAIQMYAGNTAPAGWLLCDGSNIEVTSADSSDYDYSYTAKGGPIYRKALNADYRNLVKIIGRTYGRVGATADSAVMLPDLRQRFPIGYNNISRYKQINRVYASYSGWNFPISQLVNPDDGNFRKIQGLSQEAVAIRREEGKLIDMVSDCYNISLTSTNLDDKVDEINSKTIFGLGSTGGELMHKLTIDEMPSHTHTLHYGSCNGAVPTGGGYYTGNVGWGDTSTNTDGSTIPYISSAGSSGAHNNMPPYIAVNFIIKY